MKKNEFINTALLIIDMQVDFCKGGVLPVPNASSLIPELNQSIKAYEKLGSIVLYTRDWHSINNSSFKGNGGLWNPHALAYTNGAAFHKDLYFPSVFSVVNKGVLDNDFGYSAFTNTKLENFLNGAGVKELYLAGVVLEYCVLNTALDAAKKGFKVTILKNLTKSLKKTPQEIEEVFKSLQTKGIKLK